MPPSAKHLDVVLHTLDRAKPARPGELVGPLRKLAEHFGRRGIIVVISDFYAEPEEIFHAIGPIVHRGNDVVLFHVMDPQEIDFSFTEPSSFEDMESGDQMPIVPDQARRRLSRAGRSAHRDADQEGGAAAGGLHAAQHQHAARLRVVPLPVDAPAAGEEEVAVAFLFPLFLLALGALAVPVLIHLTQKERKAVVEFPSLMFLRKIPYESVQRRRIRDALLLMLRLAALALIVAAFARPFLRGSELAAAPGGARDIVVLLDRSYSMGYGDTWARAQRAAAAAIESATPADRISVVLFADVAEVALRSTPDRGRAVGEINAAAPGPGSTKFGPALKLAGSLLAESLLPRKEVIVVSDFQRGGWLPDDTLRMPGGTLDHAGGRRTRRRG